MPVRRVLHFMDVCFNRTETFIHDFVRGCSRYEAWCLGNTIDPQPGFDFERVRCVRIQKRDNFYLGYVERGFTRALRVNARMYWQLARIRPSVIHAHFGPAGWQILPYARRMGIPLLTSFYGYDASSLPRLPGWPARLRRLFRDGAGVIVEGPAMARRLEALGCPAEKIHLLPITIHLASYPFRPRNLEPSQTLRLLFVGRFVPKKGLPILLRALSLAKRELRPFELRVIGGGPGEEEAHRLTAELGLSEQVRFLGYKPRAEMVREMEQSHVLAVPSQTAPDGDTEGGAPTVLLEAQATGLPVLSTTHADIVFVIGPASRPYLAEEASPERLADRLLALVADSPRWGELAEQGRAHVATQHGAANFAQLEQLYDQFVN